MRRNNLIKNDSEDCWDNSGSGRVGRMKICVSNEVQCNALGFEYIDGHCNFPEQSINRMLALDPHFSRKLIMYASELEHAEFESWMPELEEWMRAEQ